MKKLASIFLILVLAYSCSKEKIVTEPKTSTVIKEAISDQKVETLTPEKRLLQIKSDYTTLQKLADKPIHCDGKKVNTQETILEGYPKGTYGQSLKKCTLNDGFAYTESRFLKHEWMGNFNFYEKDQKLFFALVTVYSEVCKSVYRIYYDEDLRAFKILANTNSCEDTAPEKRYEVKDQQEFKEISAMADQYRKWATEMLVSN